MKLGSSSGRSRLDQSSAAAPEWKCACEEQGGTQPFPRNEFIQGRSSRISRFWVEAIQELRISLAGAFSCSSLGELLLGQSLVMTPFLQEKGIHTHLGLETLPKAGGWRVYSAEWKNINTAREGMKDQSEGSRRRCCWLC